MLVDPEKASGSMKRQPDALTRKPLPADLGGEGGVGDAVDVWSVGDSDARFSSADSRLSKSVICAG
jgi:hypothetical protein